MPRQIILKSFAFLSPMDDWKVKEDPSSIIDETQRQQDQQQTEEAEIDTEETAGGGGGGDDDFFFGGGGDLLDETEYVKPKIDYNIRSYYLPLASMKSLFYVFVPFVAMGDDFKAITEEDLELFQLTPTIDFTLSLNLHFHGDKNRMSTKMFENFSNIRFLRELKLNGRVSSDDFKQIAGLYFLTSLELCSIRQVSDDALAHLHGLVNLEKLVINSWQRLTEKGVQEIPKIAPNLREFILIDCPQLTHDSFSAFPLSPSLVKSLRSLTIKRTGDSSEQLYHGRRLFQYFHKMVNLESFEIVNYKLFSEENLSSMVENMPNLRHIRVVDCGIHIKRRLIKLIGRKVGENLQTLQLDNMLDELRNDAYLMYFARYFKSLSYLSMNFIYRDIFFNFRRRMGYDCDPSSGRAGRDALQSRVEVQGMIQKVKDQNFTFFEKFVGSSSPQGAFMRDVHTMRYREEETDEQSDSD